MITACGNGETPVAEQARESAMPEKAVVETAMTPEGESVKEQIKPQMVEESAAEEQESVLENKPIILAQATTPDDLREWKFAEGTHYARLVPAQPTVGGADKIEVAEVFWYGCNHCHALESYINQWEKQLPKDVYFKKSPATWNPTLMIHARLFYTAKALGIEEKVTPAAFTAIHRERRFLTGNSELEYFFKGVYSVNHE